MNESTIEAYLRDKVREASGRAYKFVSPGNDGVPDRLVCLPGGKAVFVELKAPGKVPTSLQRRRHMELRKMGFVVFGRVDSKADVDRAVQLMTGRGYLATQDIEELEMQDVE